MATEKKLSEKLRTAKSKEEFAEKLAENGIAADEEKAGQLYERMQAPSELSDDELEQIAGGMSLIRGSLGLDNDLDIFAEKYRGYCGR